VHTELCDDESLRSNLRNGESTTDLLRQHV
jgi:hypothetical protein